MKGEKSGMDIEKMAIQSAMYSGIPQSAIDMAFCEHFAGLVLAAQVGKEDAKPTTRLNGKKAMVQEVMTYLNLQARRNYRVETPNGGPTANADIIAQRLKDGYTVEQCKAVIGFKSDAWMGDSVMDQYLNPQTLFRKSNFEKYLAEAEAV